MKDENPLEEKLKSTPKSKSARIYKFNNHSSSTSTSSGKRVAKSSINFQKVGVHAFKHNAREEEKKANTIFEEFSKDNECNQSSTEAQKMFNDLYNQAKEKRLKRGLNKTADKKNTLWEAIVNLKSEHHLKDVEALAKKIEEQTGFTTLQVAIHKDEGQEKEGKLIRKNHHAHITFFTLSKSDGQQMYRREFMNRTMLTTLQDITATHLGMERGVKGSNAKRLDHKTYKAIARQQEEQEQKLELLKEAIKQQRERLKEQKAQRPDYAKLEQVNKDLKKEIEHQSLSVKELESMIDKKVKTIEYQNERLSNYEKQAKDRSLTIKGEISKERVTISKGLLKKEDTYIYKSESVEKFIEQSKINEQKLKHENQQLLEENSNYKEFAKELRTHFKQFDLKEIIKLVIREVPSVQKVQNVHQNSLDKEEYTR